MTDEESNSLEESRSHLSDINNYEPDFAVETKTEKLLCEPKRASEMTDEVVLAKARAAVEWCKHATEHARTLGGKPWSYVLIPHDVINASATLDGLIAAFGSTAVAEVH